MVNYCPEAGDTKIAEACQPSSAKIAYVLIADGLRAKLYRSHHPFTELNLISIRVNFTGRASKTKWSYDRKPKNEPRTSIVPTPEAMDFFKTLCLVLRTDYQAGKFDALMMILRPEFLALRHGLLDNVPHDRMCVAAAEDPGQMTEQDLLGQLREKFAAA